MISINQVYSLLAILFLSFFSFAQKENSDTLFEVSVNGTKWLFDSSLNNFSGQNNDLSFIEKELIRLEEINNNFRVPTFAEIELMLTQKIALPDYTEKVECAKMCYCSNEKYGSYWFPDNVDCRVGHYCKKCSSWTKDQKRYNVCPTCNGNGRTYCGKSYTCTKCKGKGYYLENRTASPLSMSGFLSEKNIILREYYLFYDNPMEYGLFWNDMKNSKTHKIIARVNYIPKEKLALAGIVLINGSKRIEKEINVVKTQDAALTKIIYDLIAKQELENAANEYMNLKYKNKDLEAKIQSELEKANSNPLELTEKEIQSFVYEYKIILNSLTTGKYSVKIDNKGKIWFNEIDYTIKFQDYNIHAKYKRINNFFSVKLNYTFTLNILDSISDPTKEEIKKNGGSRINWHVNPEYENLKLLQKRKQERKERKEQVNYVNNDKYFYTTTTNSTLIDWLGKKYIRIISSIGYEIITYNKEVPLNKIKCSFMEKKVRSVNGIETNNQVGYFNWQEFELKRKRMGFARAKFITAYGGVYGGFFGGMLWGLIRYNEYVQANDGGNL
jgi:hypothetical protein